MSRVEKLGHTIENTLKPKRNDYTKTERIWR